MMQISHWNGLSSVTNPAENPSTGFLLRSAREGRVQVLRAAATRAGGAAAAVRTLQLLHQQVRARSRTAPHPLDVCCCVRALGCGEDLSSTVHATARALARSRVSSLRVGASPPAEWADGARCAPLGIGRHARGSAHRARILAAVRAGGGASRTRLRTVSPVRAREQAGRPPGGKIGGPKSRPDESATPRGSGSNLGVGVILPTGSSAMSHRLILPRRGAWTLRHPPLARCYASRARPPAAAAALATHSHERPRGAPRPSAQRRGLCATSSESLSDELVRFAGYSQTSVTLKATLDTGLGLLLDSRGPAPNEALSLRRRTLIQIATFLRRELPVRLARRVLDLHSLPQGLHAMPSVVLVREWYEQSFAEIRRSPPPIDIESESAFARLLQAPPPRCRPHTPHATRAVRRARRSAVACTQGIYERHAPTLVTMAKGVHELRNELETSRGDRCDGPPLTRARGPSPAARPRPFRRSISLIPRQLPLLRRERRARVPRQVLHEPDRHPDPHRPVPRAEARGGRAADGVRAPAWE